MDDDIHVYIHMSSTPQKTVKIYTSKLLSKSGQHTMQAYRVGGDEGKSEALRKLIGQAANSLGKNSPTDGFLFQRSRLRHRLQGTAETLLHNKLMT